jgi:hypothetical protein
MAKIILNPTIEQAHGKIGNMVFRRAHTGEMTLIKAADMSRVKWSKAQKEHRKRFKLAVAYAKAAMAEPKIRARYEKEAAKKNKRPFDLAVSDYFKGKNLLSGDK